MADKKISDLTAATSLADADLFEIENAGGNSRKITVANARASISGLTLITETVTSSSASNVTFSSIPATYRDLEIQVRGRGDASATNVSVQLQFNSDTATNYEWEQLNVQGVTGGNGGTTTVAQIVPGVISAATARASAAGNVHVIVHDYRGTTFHKTTSSFGGAQAGSSSTSMFAIVGYGQWRSTSAITAVKVFLSSGNFVDGSVVSLYGRM